MKRVKTHRVESFNRHKLYASNTCGELLQRLFFPGEQIIDTRWQVTRYDVIEPLIALNPDLMRLMFEEVDSIEFAFPKDTSYSEVMKLAEKCVDLGLCTGYHLDNFEKYTHAAVVHDRIGSERSFILCNKQEAESLDNMLTLNYIRYLCGFIDHSVVETDDGDADLIPQPACKSDINRLESKIDTLFDELIGGEESWSEWT